MKNVTFLAALIALAPALHAELKLPAIIGDHMVLQQNQADAIWGWDNPGTKVTVAFAGQSKSAEAGADGRWTVKLDPVPANAQPQSITVTGSSTREIKDVLVGEVWICSGQSNMGFQLKGERAGDLEMQAAKGLPNLRLIRVPNKGTQEPQTDFQGEWKQTTPESAGNFSAVGFLYGKYLQETLQIPVGLIDDAWGGSAAEAWVKRESLEKDPRFAELMARTKQQEEKLQTPKAKEDYEAAMEKWKQAAADAKAANKPVPRAPGSPQSWLSGNARPGNIYNGVVLPTLGYGIKGIIWYQGESNAGRAWEYGQLFPYMIEQWRKEQGQGDFPFYWVQLADFKPEKAEPGDSDWAELRESQTKTQSLPNTGQAVIIDVGEGRDIHPRDKHTVATRLVRWALAKDYGIQIPYHSPEFKSVEVSGNKATVTLETFGSGLRPFDTLEVKGFAVCGDDKVWHWAKGTVIGKDKVEVSAPDVEHPIAVRYGWADNPVCNLYSETNLPVTPFRSDDFEMTTKPKTPGAPAAAPAVPKPATPPTSASL